MRRRKSGLTMIEILVVVGIIAILVGILVPSLSMVKNTAKTVKQRAQFTAIDLGLAAFRSDYGDYPPSSWWDPALPGRRQDYCGAQKLAEALLGWDLLGFHPDSAWRADGLDQYGGPATYDPLKVNAAAVSLDKRRGRYVELETANAFRLGRAVGQWDGLFINMAPLAANTYVLCDVFGISERKIQLANGKTAVPGTPILYYRANPTSKILDPSRPEVSIYCARDNVPLIGLGRLADAAKPPALRRLHPLDSSVTGFDFFYEYIRDPKVDARAWPYRPDSYILISAGPDGLYGTHDDIRNFGN